MSLNNADEYRDWSEIENKLSFQFLNDPPNGPHGP